MDGMQMIGIPPTFIPIDVRLGEQLALASVIMSKGLFKFWDLSPLGWHIQRASTQTNTEREKKGIKRRALSHTPQRNSSSSFSFKLYYDYVRVWVC
jgi:hypothetical protein